MSPSCNFTTSHRSEPIHSPGRKSSTRPSDGRQRHHCETCNMMRLNKNNIASYSRTALFFLLFLCRSEAFASRQPQGGIPFLLRGGETTQKRGSSTAAFVMSQPPLSPLFSPPEDEPLKSKKNGFHKPTPIEFVAETKLPTDVGQFLLRAYRTKEEKGGLEPCVIYSRNKPPQSNSAVPIRIHDQCITSEVFRSQRCDCKEQLHMALKYIQRHGGCIIYLQQEGRGIGLANKIAAYALQDVGLDTVDANLHLGFPEDMREYGVVPGILRDMNINSIQLMTNNPRKVDELEALGVVVERTLPMVVPNSNPYNHQYLLTKRDRMQHENFSGLKLPTTVPPTLLRNGETKENNGVNTMKYPLTKNNGEEETGVVAHEDGYCFGKQSVVDAIRAVEMGEMIIVVDDLNRENEGDFIMAADAVTPLQMAKIVRYSSGVICVAMEGQRMEELGLPPMVSNNEDPKETAFAVSVDATKEHGISTGISAGDRTKTVQLLADPTARASDFSRPGHLFPLRAKAGGVLERDGHTEATVDFSRLAGRGPCGILCEIVSEENPAEMMRLPELKRFAAQHGYIITSIADLIQYRKETGQ